MKMSYRIAQHTWLHDDEFAKLRDSVRKHIDDIDELALFVGISHSGYYPEKICRETMPVLQERMQILRDLGVKSVGVNMWITLGHVDEAWEWIEQPPFQTVIGHDGSTSYNCICPRDERFIQHNRILYSLVAGAQPQFIWVDDDLRMQHHMVEFPCFCHNCITKFNRMTNNSYTREKLVKALDDPSNNTLRRKFLEYNRDAMNDLLKAIGDSVRSVSHNIHMGLMTTAIPWNSYALSDQEGMLKALGADMIRPGGGFYTDDMPLALFNKLWSVSLQNEHDSGIPDNQYELEDFPVCWNKSTHMHQLEIAAAFMSGCNGIALNSVLPDETDALMNGLHECYPMWKDLLDHINGMKLRGYWPAYYLDADASTLSQHSIFSHDLVKTFDLETALTRTGLTCTMHMEDAEVTAIRGDMMAAIPDSDIETIFAKGVFMDDAALKILEARGYTDLAGCKIGHPWHSGLLEEYTDHPCNGEFAGVRRDVFMTFWDRDGITVHTLEPMDGAQVLSKLYSITGTYVGIGATFFTNRLGGCVAVLSYFPFNHLDMPGKIQTTPLLMDVLASNKFPILVTGARRVLPVLRSNDSGFAVLIVNANFDATDSLDIRLTCPCSKVRVYTTDGKIVFPNLVLMKRRGEYTYISVPALPAWSGYIILGNT